MSYQAIICPITVTKHPDPKVTRIQVGHCQGFTVVVGIDTHDGQLGVFFPTEGRLSERMCEFNKLMRGQGGYFDENRRVRAQKFQGIKSEGLWLPLESLQWTGVDLSTLTSGTLIDTINDQLVCEKYYSKKTRMLIGAKKIKRGETPHFRKVGETPQLRFVSEQIGPRSTIYWTEKLHGTSGRVACALDSIPNPWWRRWLRLPERQEYRTLVGSKNVILTHKPGGGYYDDESFRNSVESWPLHKGETIYYEIVGYVGPGKPIMDFPKIEDKELRKHYGDFMAYTYGCLDGSHREFVYRITRTNVQGIVTELTWPQVKARCRELGIEHVPEISDPWMFSGDVRDIADMAEILCHGSSTICPYHIREGVCLRIEGQDGKIWVAKHKSYEFGVLEGYIKSKDDSVDLEEIS